MRQNILTLCLLFLSLGLSAQLECHIIRLCSQAEVDSFPVKYRHCDQIGILELNNTCGWIHNLDSLYPITVLLDLKVPRMDSLISMSGLKNLRKARMIDIVQIRDFEAFQSLDTIHELKHISAYSGANLSLYSNIKHIERSITLQLIESLAGLPDYTCGNTFSIAATGSNTPNSLSDIMPVNCTRLDRLVIRNNQNLSLNGIGKIDHIRYFLGADNSLCDFTDLSHVKSFGQFILGNQNMEDNDFPVLYGIEEINLLSLVAADKLYVLSDLFPNLKKINKSIFLRANPDLNDISLLDSIDIPSQVFDDEDIPSMGRRLLINDNPLLEECLSPFICQALEVYPDSVFIGNNAGICEKQDLLTACISNTNESLLFINETELFPNPANDIVNWTSKSSYDHIEIINSCGQVVHSCVGCLNRMDISFLPSGMYFIAFSNRSSRQVVKLMKI
jgi:hypothetical protein